MPNFQGVWSLSEQYQNAGIWPLPPTIALVFGGDSNNTKISSFVMSTSGSATDFGDIVSFTFTRGGSASSSTRGLTLGGFGPINTISYVTIQTKGNTTDFGDLTVSRNRLSAASNQTRALAMGGDNGNVVDYVTIASTGNATDFGDLVENSSAGAACASPTRALQAAGNNGSARVNVIQYLVISSTGNATDFGDMTEARNVLASFSSNTRGVFSGGNSPSLSPNDRSTIDYVTISSTGNATDFGDLTVAREGLCGTSSSTLGYSISGSDTNGVKINTIDYITIASAGNALDFGDLDYADNSPAACSNAHGGLS